MITDMKFIGAPKKPSPIRCGIHASISTLFISCVGITYETEVNFIELIIPVGIVYTISLLTFIYLDKYVQVQTIKNELHIKGGRYTIYKGECTDNGAVEFLNIRRVHGKELEIYDISVTAIEITGNSKSTIFYAEKVPKKMLGKYSVVVIPKEK